MKSLYSALSIMVFTSAAWAADPLATVNGQAITQEDIEQYRANHPDVAQQLPAQRILEELVRREVLVQAAQAGKLTEKPEYIRQKEALLNNFLADYTMREYLRAHPVAESELRKAYEMYTGQFKDQQQYKVSHIQVADEAAGQKIIVQLNAGENFAKLAKSLSEDSGSAADGGTLGWLNGPMLTLFEEPVKKLKKGEFSQQPVKSDFGWHVLLLEDLRDVPLPSYEQVQSALRQALENQALFNYVSQLKKEAKIEMQGEPK